MGRVYAGILGPLAMAVVICRGWLGSGGVEGTLTSGHRLSRSLFAVVGAIHRATRPSHDRRIGSRQARAAVDSVRRTET